jgi:hypothetical protein
MIPVPYSAPPVSGPYGYGYGMPMPVPPPAKKRLTGVLVALTSVFLLTTGVLATLYVLGLQESSRLSERVTQLTSDNSTQKDKLASTQRELDSTKRDLRDSGDELKDMTTQKTAMADCINAIVDWWNALDATNNRDTPETIAAGQNLDRLCAVADKYLSRG